MNLTETGAQLGTPAYMAPEQHEGGPVDARTDQWAFACALYGALYRQRAFVGETSAELAIAVKVEKPRPEPATTKVPRAIRASIRRALSHDPVERFGTMDDLIVALTPPRRAWVAAGVVGGLAATAAVGVASTWNSDRSRALSDRFMATGIGNAAEAAEHFGAVVERYRDDWTAMRTRACTDGRRGAISADLLDRRMHCLDLRLAEVETVVDTAVKANATTVNGVNGALARVTSVATVHRSDRHRAATDRCRGTAGDRARRDRRRSRGHAVQSRPVRSGARARRERDQGLRADRVDAARGQGAVRGPKRVCGMVRAPSTTVWSVREETPSRATGCRSSPARRSKRREVDQRRRSILSSSKRTRSRATLTRCYRCRRQRETRSSVQSELHPKQRTFYEIA